MLSQGCYLTVLAFLLAFNAKSQTAGIQFVNGGFKQALAIAKNTKKPLFVEIYLNGCPHCEALAPILNEKEVGAFYNKNYVSLKLEANSKESVDLQKERKIGYPEFPFFLFFDENGQLIHLAAPAEIPTKAEFINEVITHGKDALNPYIRAANYDARYQAGERDLKFLVGYAKAAKTFKNAKTLSKINASFASLFTKPEDLIAQSGFYILKRFIDDIANPMAKYFFLHVPEYTAKYGAKEVKEAGESIIFQSLYGPKSDSLSAEAIVEMREAMVKLGVPPNESAARTLLKELDAHIRTKNTSAAVTRFNAYRLAVKTLGAPDYAYLMRYFNEKSTDASYLPSMQQWADDALRNLKPEEKTSKPVADIYKELAEAYRIMGKKEVALPIAQKALAIAKTAKIDLKPYETQVSQLK